jgi:hypothetical protein
MGDTGGVVLIVAGSAGVLLGAFALRRRLPAMLEYVLLAACSVLVGAGSLVVQDHVTTADWIVTLALLAVLGPAHVRFLMGAFGPSAPPGTAGAEPV